jgi:hypothetical protein
MKKMETAVDIAFGWGMSQKRALPKLEMNGTAYLSAPSFTRLMVF